MKKILSIFSVLACLSSMAFAQEQYNIGWNIKDPNNAFTTSFKGHTYDVAKDASLTFTVQELASGVTSFSFGVHVYDPGGNNKNYYYTNINVGDVFAINFDAGQSIDFWLGADGDIVTSKDGGLYAFTTVLPPNQLTLTFHTDNGDYSSYWNSVLKAEASGKVPPSASGQPMPGIITTVVIGLGLCGVYLRKRKTSK